MKLDTVASILTTSGLGRLGKEIFKNHMPAEFTEGILLRDGFSGTDINWELPGFYKTDFQLIVRSKSYQNGLEMIENAVRALTLGEVTVLDTQFRYMRPKRLPFSYPIAPSNHMEFVVPIDCCFTIV